MKAEMSGMFLYPKEKKKNILELSSGLTRKAWIEVVSQKCQITF